MFETDLDGDILGCVRQTSAAHHHVTYSCMTRKHDADHAPSGARWPGPKRQEPSPATDQRSLCILTSLHTFFQYH